MLGQQARTERQLLGKKKVSGQFSVVTCLLQLLVYIVICSAVIHWYGLPRRAKLRALRLGRGSPGVVLVEKIQEEAADVNPTQIRMPSLSSASELTHSAHQSQSLNATGQLGARSAGWRRRRRRGSRTSLSSTLILYELYYSKAAWPHIHDREPFRGVSVYPGMVRNGSRDMDATSLLPVLTDLTYQGLLCEYGAMFALDSHLEREHGKVPWIGFQSWKARKKGFGLTGPAIREMILDMRKREGAGEDESGDTKIFYYWSTWGIKDVHKNCLKEHTHCSKVYSSVFERMFAKDISLDNGLHGKATQDKPKLLPPLPVIPKEYSFCSYWVMHVDHFQKFITFARMVFVTLENLWDLHGDIERCPLTFRTRRYNSRLCWCFIMERVVNLWVYHSGTKMLWVDHNTGNIVEQLPIKDRKMWSHWFGENQTAALIENFHRRLPPASVKLYTALGGKQA